MNEQQFSALPEEQRIAEQKRLQALGLYPAGARIDGKWGPGTNAAYSLEGKRVAEDAASARNAELEKERLAIEKLKATSQATKATAETEATQTKTARQQEYNRQASSPEGLATTIAAGPVALTAGKAVGLGLGGGINTYQNAGQVQRNETLKGLAADRRAGLTTREGAITGAKLAGVMPYTNPAMRVASRMGAHAGLGGIFLGTGAELLGDYDPEQAFYPRMADRAFGLGSIGAGTGLITQGIKQAAAPGVSPDAQALGVINSSQLRRNNEPAVKGPAEGTLTALKQEAKSLDIPGRSKLTTKGALSAAIENVKQRAKSLPKAGVLAPLAAAEIAYQMTPSRAEAATGEASAPADNSEALTNAAIAGGGTYGAGKLLSKVPVFSNALGAAGRFAGKVLGPELMLASPQAMYAGNAILNKIGLGNPQLNANASGMAQIPTRNPERGIDFQEALANFQALMQEQGQQAQ
jgi:hypothetical protein